MSVAYGVTLYNKARYIEPVLRAIEAERRQTGGEITVYDDVSTDGSAAIVERLADEFPLRLIRGAINQGVPHATNCLIAAAGSARFLKLVDADDLLVPGSTLALAAALDRLGASFVFGRTMPSGTIDDAPGASAVRVDAPFRRLLRSVEFNPSGSLFVLADLRAVTPLPPGRYAVQDFCMALRLARTKTIAQTRAIIAFSPVETENRLSRRVAPLYRDLALMAAQEIATASRADAGFALRRNAARALKYFRREAPGLLHPRDHLFLHACRLTPPFLAAQSVSRHLRRVASILERDQDRVLT